MPPAPAGTPYDWYQRAVSLVHAGSPQAALGLLERLLVEDPQSRSLCELRARALYDVHRYADAVEAFERLTHMAPDDDYAHFGLGMALWRLQCFPEARDHLALASVMRPNRPEYAQALREVRATLAARREAGLPMQGPVGTELPLGE